MKFYYTATRFERFNSGEFATRGEVEINATRGGDALFDALAMAAATVNGEYDAVNKCFTMFDEDEASFRELVATRMERKTIDDDFAGEGEGDYAVYSDEDTSDIVIVANSREVSDRGLVNVLCGE